MLFKSILLMLFCCSATLASFAAFPVHRQAESVGNRAAPVDSPVASGSKPGQAYVSYGSAQGHRHRVVYKSRGAASALAFIGIYPFYCMLLGMQRLYLGYIPEGIAQMVAPWVGVAAIALATTAVVTSPVYLAGIILGGALIAAAVAWHISDYVRIRLRTLRPKWGYYDDDVQRMRAH